MAHHHSHGGHDHEGHHHHHAHLPHGTGNIRAAFFLNVCFTLLEIVGGIYTNSVAILSDALHDLGDSLSLGLSWYFQKLSSRKRDATFSYGYGRFSLLGAVVNSIVLLVGAVFVLREAIPRLFEPQAVRADGMILLAILGVVFNGAAFLKLTKGNSLNERAVALHLLEDVLGWLAVLVGSVVMYFTEIPVLDPALSIGITLYVLWNVFRNLKDGFRILLQAVPKDVSVEQVQDRLKDLGSIADIHDIHLWTLDGEYNILTVHLSLPKKVNYFEEALAVKDKARRALKGLPVQHVTIEVEGEEDPCQLREC